MRILGMIANPMGNWEVIDVQAERQRIDEVLRDKDIMKSVHFRWLNGETLDDLFQLMQPGPWHIFHFIGHEGTDRIISTYGENLSEACVAMRDGHGDAVKVSASKLGRILEDGGVRIALLNCGESVRGRGAQSPAAALIKAGVPMAVAMQFPISNAAASRFAAMFYGSLIRGRASSARSQ